MTGIIKGIEHFAIAAFDPHRLARWYIEHLECRLALDTGKTVYVRSANSTVLEFVFAERQTPPPQMRDTGLRHIAFLVDDLDSACEELAQRGISFVSPITEMPGLRLRFFQDPEGNFLHIVERASPLPD
jgi:glyoxylase I family protein